MTFIFFTSPKQTRSSYLVKVFARGSHLLPGLVEQLYADAEKLLEGAIVGEEHGMKVVAVFAGWGRKQTEDEPVKSGIKR